MTLFWRLRDIPELGPLPKGQQTEVWVATAGQRLRDPIALLALIPCVGLAGIGGYIGTLVIQGSLGVIVGAGIGGGLGSLIYWHIAAIRSRPILAAEVRARST